MKMRVKKNLSEFVDDDYTYVITQEMLQFTGKVIDVHKRVWGWYEHDIIGKDYSLMWHKTWLEPVEEEMSFEECFDLYVNHYRMICNKKCDNSCFF